MRQHPRGQPGAFSNPKPPHPPPAAGYRALQPASPPRPQVPAALGTPCRHAHPNSHSGLSASPPSGGSASSSELPEGTRGAAPSLCGLVSLTSTLALICTQSISGVPVPQWPAHHPVTVGPCAAALLPGGSFSEERGYTHLLFLFPVSSSWQTHVTDAGVFPIPLPKGKS